jgi:hypothetical protein
VDNKPPYLREMLLSQGNAYAFLGSLAAATVLSIPFGFGIGAIPLVAFAAGEAIAAMYLPDSPSFRERVDRRYRSRAREATRAHLLEEIGKRGGPAGRSHGSLDAYRRMIERVRSLYRVAADSRTELTARDAERLDDATLDYLSMWLASLVIDDRARAVDPADIERRIDAIDRELKAPRPGTDPRQLQQARNEYAALTARHRRMLSRRTAIQAAMLSMPDQMEEIYQIIMTAPASREMGSKLDEAISRLRLEEQIEAELAGDLSESVPELTARMRERPVPVRRVAAARQEVR